MRSILHVNIDSFCALVERNRRPDLVGRPVIVGRPKGNTSGVVVSASGEAMKFGVEEGMGLRQAQRSCPGAVVLKADFAMYRQVFEEFLDILAQYSPLLEPCSLGRTYLDVTASRRLFGEPHQIAECIVAQVRKQLRLRACVGCASNKLIARVASESSVSAPVALIPPGSESDFISPLPVAVLDAVNPKIVKRLNDLGISKVGELARIPEGFLVRQFGPIGGAIRKQCLGMDSSQVKAGYPLDIIIIERMFASVIEEPAELEAHLREMVGEAVMKLRKRGSLAGEITLELKIEDLRLKIGEGEAPAEPASTVAFFRFKKPTGSAYAMLCSLTRMLESRMAPGMEVCGVRVTLSDLTPGESSQLSLLGEREARQRLDRTVDLIRERFGDGSLFFASAIAPAGRGGVLPRMAA